MKRTFFLLLLLPIFTQAQKIKMNGFDKFIQKRRVETFPITLKSGPAIQMSISFASIGAALYVQLSGTGIGTNIVSPDDQVIFLLDNDSTVTVKSTGLQTVDFTTATSSYKHNYLLSLPDLERLGEHGWQALRKYHSEKFDDVYVTQEAGEKARKLTELFIEELKRTKASAPAMPAIAIKDVRAHINDSVAVTGRVLDGKYLTTGTEAFTVLHVSDTATNASLLTLIIPAANRKNFGTAPENFYPGKQVRITGRLQLYKDKPQMMLRKKEQLTLMADTTNTAVAVTKQAPAFPGGQNVWIDFLNRNIKTPPGLINGEKKIVVAQFLVGADGSVSNFQITQSAGSSFDEEVLRVLQRMPKWKAALENGRPADAVVTQSITFSAGSKSEEMSN